MRKSTSLLRWLTVFYAILSLIFLVTYFWRFRFAPVSDSPVDWAGFAQMIAALLGLPLAMSSIALVLQSVQLQQEQLATQQRQHDEKIERENVLLDPQITGIEIGKAGHGGEQGVRLSVQGTARFMSSRCPDGIPVASSTDADGHVNVTMWHRESGSNNLCAFLQYLRANGTTGFYWVLVMPPGQGEAKPSFVVNSVSGPTKAEEGISLRILATT